MKKLSNFGSLAVLMVVFSVSVFGLVASADHSWGGYHWARTSNPFTLKLGDNVSSVWDSYLATTSTDWSVSPVLDMTIVPGVTNPKNCRAVSGRIEVCNSKYGNNGWLGIASVWVNGSHITQATVKLNDTYYNTVKYNKPAWRNLVMCQEVGHAFGLDHQDEAFDNTNLGTCMDYTNDPDGTLYGQLNNEHPNFHDYEQVSIIYSHADVFNSFSSSLSVKNSNASEMANNMDTSNQSEWGKAIRASRGGQNSLYERNFGGGHKVFTFVVWAN